MRASVTVSDEQYSDMSIQCLARSGLPGTKRDGGTEPQSLYYVPNIPDLNPKFLRSAYVMIAIHPSDGDVNPGGPLGAFLKE